MLAVAILALFTVTITACSQATGKSTSSDQSGCPFEQSKATCCSCCSSCPSEAAKKPAPVCCCEDGCGCCDGCQGGNCTCEDCQCCGDCCKK